MRRPTSLLAGLMWFDPDRPDALDRIRHNAQERDGARRPPRLLPPAKAKLQKLRFSAQTILIRMAGPSMKVKTQI